ncbi:MAG: hypothetical protein R3F55_21310 [Alphaproteobacteria bacterium]
MPAPAGDRPGRRLWRGGWADADPAAGALWAASGVLAERLTVGVDRLLLPVMGEADVPPFVPVDVAAVFEAAAAAGEAPAWLGPGDAPALGGSDEAVARIRTHLAEGRLVFAPPRPAMVADAALLGWWTFDPVTGAVRDEMENGRHQSGTEYQATNEPARRSTPAYRSLGRRVLCTMNRAVGVISLVLGLSGSPEAMQGAWQAAKVEAKIARAAEETRRRGQRAAAMQGACGAGGAPK